MREREQEARLKRAKTTESGPSVEGRREELSKMLKDAESLLCLDIPEVIETKQEKRNRVIRDGRAENYPRSLAGLIGEGRIDSKLDDMRQILSGTTPSSFMNSLRDYCNSRELLRVTSVDLAYDGLIPGNGYYGPDGGRAVSEAIFLKIKGEITAACQRVNWMRPLQPSQVNVCVLVPEMLIRFIAEDRNISVTQAAEVLERSTAYGNALFSDSNEPRIELLGAFDDVSDESDDGSNDPFLGSSGS
jgi:hypothetical protein